MRRKQAECNYPSASHSSQNEVKRE